MKTKKDMLPVEIDRVGNVEQRELRLSEAGVSRKKVYVRLMELLDAVKMERVVLEDGRVEMVEVADQDRRAKGLEMALRLFGDMKDNSVNVQVNNNLLDVSEVRERLRSKGKIK